MEETNEPKEDSKPQSISETRTETPAAIESSIEAPSPPAETPAEPAESTSPTSQASTLPVGEQTETPAPQTENMPAGAVEQPAIKEEIKLEPAPQPETPPPSAPAQVSQPQSPQPISSDLPAKREKAKAVRAQKTARRLDAILKFAETRRHVANDDIQKLLRVSDATATRYLKRLVTEGKLNKTGNRRSARYQIPSL